MIQMASSIDRRPTRVLVESDSGSGAQYYRCDFLVPEGFSAKLDRESRLALYERYKSIPELPHAFTIEEQTSGPIPAHFHRVPQFQVITGGQGKLGRHAVRGFAVHYTDPYTAYGPIVPGDGSTLSYYTLRMQYDPGANYLNLPGARELLQPSRKRFLLVDPDAVNVATPETLLARTTTSLDTLIPEEDDGVAAYLLRVAPGAVATGPDPSVCGGQYYIVANGSLQRDGAELPQLSCLYVSGSEPPLQVTAGRAGLEALVLQFPRHATTS
ncbi:MAG: hypothetical protein OEW79_11100 [Betaproteobacteria bacterium]|jgi:hypothetical protein|nr:hypothetical protein [Betaproteobacteria bacterium]MDH4293699.1 hypothetical protein [Betaproteobacteria bacterium]MDH5343362.1 hypothetical protein [Betaproteobacteria bacterium]